MVVQYDLRTKLKNNLKQDLKKIVDLIFSHDTTDYNVVYKVLNFRKRDFTKYIDMLRILKEYNFDTPEDKMIYNIVKNVLYDAIFHSVVYYDDRVYQNVKKHHPWVMDITLSYPEDGYGIHYINYIEEMASTKFSLEYDYVPQHDVMGELLELGYDITKMYDSKRTIMGYILSSCIFEVFYKCIYVNGEDILKYCNIPEDISPFTDGKTVLYLYDKGYDIGQMKDMIQKHSKDDLSIQRTEMTMIQQSCKSLNDTDEIVQFKTMIWDYINQFDKTKRVDNKIVIVKNILEFMFVENKSTTNYIFQSDPRLKDTVIDKVEEFFKKYPEEFKKYRILSLKYL